MAREKRTPEENARREKIRELLQMANIGSMDDIQSLFKETIAEFMENGLSQALADSPAALLFSFSRSYSSWLIRMQVRCVCVFMLLLLSGDGSRAIPGSRTHPNR